MIITTLLPLVTALRRDRRRSFLRFSFLFTLALPSPVVSYLSAFDTVQVVQHNKKDKRTRIKNLQVGDWVLVDSSNNSTKDDGVYEPVYSFGYYSRHEGQEFLKIQTERNPTNPLKISKHHWVYLFLLPPSSSSTTSSSITSSNATERSPVLLRADQIQVGDRLFSGASKKEGVDDETTIVTNISTAVYRKGVYLPLTPSGRMVVNGVLISTYQDKIAPPFDSQNHTW